MVGEEKSNGEIYWVFGLFAVLITLNFLIVNSFADECSTANQTCVDGLNPWYVFFMRFQTLITGLLAIVAALITVRQMRRSDKRADARHEDLLRLQIDRKQDGIETIKLTYLEGLRRHIRTCRGLHAAIEQYRQEPDNKRKFPHPQYNYVKHKVSEFQQHLNHETWREYNASLSVLARSAHAHALNYLDAAMVQSLTSTQYYNSNLEEANSELDKWLDTLQRTDEKAAILYKEIGGTELD